MKKFTKQEILELYGQVTLGEISFSRMVEIMNERVSERMKEMTEPQYKDGNFVVNMNGSVLIFKNKVGDKVYSHAYLTDCLFLIISAPSKAPIERCATEAEKQKLLDALAKEGKRWNAEKLCVEDIPKRKFQKGDKVRIKHGVSGKTHRGQYPCFSPEMDYLIGKTMTVDRYTDRSNYVVCEGMYLFFLEEWLEPYDEELKKGDLAIFWDYDKKFAIIRRYYRSNNGVEYRRHQDTQGLYWANAIKFESIEQYERLIKGEI